MRYYTSVIRKYLSKSNKSFEYLLGQKNLFKAKSFLKTYTLYP